MDKKLILVIILISFFIGAAGSIAIGRFAIPYLATYPALSGIDRLATTSPIIINRREQVQLNEGVNLIDLIKQAGNVKVGIFDAKNNFLGNGIIVTSDGLIMTPTSVLRGQTQVSVTTADGQIFPAVIKSQEPATNLTLMSIPATGLATAQFEEAAKLSAGQRVIYLGRSNTKFEHQAVAGLVTQSLANQLSTKQVSSDAVFTPDYFGGPIVNLSGKVTGLVVNNTENIIGEDLQTALNAYLTTNK